MKNIVVCIGNDLLSEAIMNMLRSSGEFKPFRLLVQKKSHIAFDCEAVAADILLMDVSYASGTTFETRLKEVKQVREKIPPCKLVLLCDENSAPDIAREVANAKKDGLIDAFFYSSVTEKYKEFNRCCHSSTFDSSACSFLYDEQETQKDENCSTK